MIDTTSYFHETFGQFGGQRSCLKLLLQHILQRLAVLGELPDTLMELLERHLVLEQGPAELGLVVDVGNLGHRRSRACCRLTACQFPYLWTWSDKVLLSLTIFGAELLGHLLLGVLELLEQRGSDGEEVTPAECLDLAGLQIIRASEGASESRHRGLSSRLTFLNEAPMTMVL